MIARGPYFPLRVWHIDSGSHAYYVADMTAKAKRDGAPDDALYKRDHIGGDGQWVTLRDLAPDHPFHARLEKLGRARAVLAP